MAEVKLDYSSQIQIRTETTTTKATSTDAEYWNGMMGSKDDYSLGIQWYFAPVFLLSWIAIFFAVAYPIFFYLPEGLRVANESNFSCRFIAERAHRILYDYEAIGEKVMGSFANENTTIEFILKEIEKIRIAMDHDRYELEVDVQMGYGSFLHWNMLYVYRGVQNVIVKLSAKSSSSQSFLLVNSHFDTKPGSPGTGDDGAMMVVMLESLRVLASSNCASFEHPIVFLFNGGEESSLKGSHAFITGHDWAPNCKAVINLDSAGSGHREVLFQGGPKHPWLMKYYSKYVGRPFATVLAQEVFASGLIPSDTDFRMFKNFGKIPGLDLAHSYNGYVYHTKYDRLDVIPLGTLQMTGDHILSLAHGLANAEELKNPEQYKDGNTVFYDFMGQFFMRYTETEGMITNSIVAVAAIVFSGISLWKFSKSGQKTSISRILQSFGIIFILHIVGFLLAIGFPLLVAVFYDLDDRSMTWFTHKWLVLGQYVCPSLFGLSLPTLAYIEFQKRPNQVSRSFQIQMILMAHSVIVALICLILTFVGIRTSYVLMLSLLFYDVFLIFVLATSLHSRGPLWVIPLLISQIIPFLYITYLFHAFLCTITPMMGRFGQGTNPDLLIGGYCALGSILSMGFIMPVLGVFQRAKFILPSLIVVTFVFAMISISSIGFPYRPKTNVGRVHFMHVRRTFYGFDGHIEKNDSGYYIDFQDRRINKPSEGFVDWTGLRSASDDCETEIMCGLPAFNYRWNNSRKLAMWLPSSLPIDIPGVSTLTLVAKSINMASSTARFEFILNGPEHMNIFIGPTERAHITNWSFFREVVENPEDWQPPYNIQVSWGKDTSPLEFYLDIEKNDGRFDEPSVQIGISGHYISASYPRGTVGDNFIKSFPNYIHCMEWPTSYDRYIF